LLIAGATISTFIFFVNRETYPEVILERKTARLRKELNRPELISWYERERPKRTKSQILSNGLIRPLKLLTRSPISFLLSLYMAVTYGLLYLLFTTVTTTFTENYGWSNEISGLAYTGLGLGFITGLIAIGTTNDRTIKRLAKANNNVFEPEMRMVSCLPYACLLPISFFWYGWTADKHVFWIVPIIGLFPFGVGMMGIFLPIMTYMVDAFTHHAASATAALAALRSLFGAFLPLAGPTMYQKLGLGWGNTLLGFIALAMIPVPVLIYRYGETLRKRYPVKL
jgi:MFS family permease